MANIKIKVPGGSTPRKREILANALFCAEIRVLQYFAIHEGYLALIENDEHAERLFSTEVLQSLEKHGFTLILPVEMKAKLTLVLKRLDIADEIMASSDELHDQGQIL